MLFSYFIKLVLQKLTEFGVERLVLPAIPSVLHTWTTAFGFSKMNESERLNFLAYTFLDFQGTVFCQKVLNGNLSAVSTLSAGIQNAAHYIIEGCNLRFLKTKDLTFA